jgi:PEGA domain
LPRLVRAVFYFAFAGCIGVMQRDAVAQSAEASSVRTGLSESLSGAAKQAYESATILRNNSDWAGAMAKYGQAYELSKDPRLLFDMAICARDLKAYARMQELLVRYEREAPATLTEQTRADVDAAMEAIRHLVGTVRVQVSEAGALLAIDGRAAGESPPKEPVVLDLGRHTIAASKAGFEPAQQVVEIVGGDNVEVSLKLLRPSRLIVVADVGSSVLVDRREMMSDRFEGPVAPGAHEVQVTARGKKTLLTHVVLRPEETRTLQVTLEGEARLPVWVWLAGGAAAVVGGAVASYFLLRPHDDGSQLTGNLQGGGRVVVSP